MWLINNRILFLSSGCKHRIKVPTDLGDDDNLATGVVFLLSPYMTQRIRAYFNFMETIMAFIASSPPKALHLITSPVLGVIN